MRYSTMPKPPAHFNPRSREGSDYSSSCLLGLSGNFNPRSREGSDKIFEYNIRTSANFNPRSREGSDYRKVNEHTIYVKFQSTLP